MSTTQNKRLGRGLGSLISGGVQASPANKSSSVAKSRASKSGVGNGRTSASNTNQQSRSDGEFQEIALGKIVPNPFQPREHFDESSNSNNSSATAKERVNYYLMTGYTFDVTENLKFKRDIQKDICRTFSFDPFF